VRQVATSLGTVLELITVVGDSGLSAIAEPEPGQRGGVRGAQVSAAPKQQVVAVNLQLIEDAKGLRVELRKLLELLDELGPEGELAAPPAAERPESVWAKVQLKAAPLGPARQERLQQRLRAVERLADWLQEQRPQRLDTTALRQRYARLSELLAPVLPTLDATGDPDAGAWAADTVQLLVAGVTVALEGSTAALQDAGLALLATEAGARGESLGRLVAPSIDTSNLLKLASKAPGWVALPASLIAVGGHAYELSNEIRGLLRNLSASGRAVVFVGSREELDGVFHGGQGARRDPLAPAVRRCPSVALERLIPFAAQQAAHALDAPLAAAQLTKVADEVRAALAPLPPAWQLERLDLLARAAVRAEQRGQAPAGGSAGLVQVLDGQREALGGLSRTPSASRWPWLQERLEGLFGDSRVLDALREELVGQDAALTELVRRLATGVFTQPLHQPLVWLAEGTPGTGKSASAAALARMLDLPVVRVNGAGFSDLHTAVAQLLGSGRGIVGSQHAGRLEQAARTGALLEVSDLDHATPNVRAYLGDLFLELVESGRATSSWGRPFCCSNLVVCFSINLPAGADERIGRQVGFGAAPDRTEQRARVAEHVRSLVSSAFLSRVGQPIVFESLSPSTLARIAVRQLRRAAAEVASRVGAPLAPLRVASGVGRCLVSGLGRGLAAYGARGLDGRARQAVATGLLPLLRGAQAATELQVIATPGPGGWPRFESVSGASGPATNTAANETSLSGGAAPRREP